MLPGFSGFSGRRNPSSSHFPQRKELKKAIFLRDMLVNLKQKYIILSIQIKSYNFTQKERCNGKDYLVPLK